MPLLPVLCKQNFKRVGQGGYLVKGAVSSMALSPWSALQAVIVTVLACFLCLTLVSPVRAQDGESGQEAATDGFIPDRYDFTVEEGNNMTVLVRRALQLYDQAKADLELSAALTIYCETNIVQDMGARDLIFPGEVISVPTPRIEQYTNSARGLSTGATAAWQAYADNADFEVAATPSNVAVADDGSVSDPAQPTEPTPTDAPQTTSDRAGENDANWYWWFIGAGTIAVIWYVLWRREGEPA